MPQRRPDGMWHLPIDLEINPFQLAIISLWSLLCCSCLMYMFKSFSPHANLCSDLVFVIGKSLLYLVQEKERFLFPQRSQVNAPPSLLCTLHKKCVRCNDTQLWTCFSEHNWIKRKEPSSNMLYIYFTVIEIFCNHHGFWKQQKKLLITNCWEENFLLFSLSLCSALSALLSPSSLLRETKNK